MQKPKSRTTYHPVWKYGQRICISNPPVFPLALKSLTTCRGESFPLTNSIENKMLVKEQHTIWYSTEMVRLVGTKDSSWTRPC